MGVLGIAWTTTVRYMKGSSIAGLSHAANSRSSVRAVYWLVIFTAGLALTIRSLVKLMEDFAAHPVITNSHLTTQPSVTFPAVTICNLNRIHCLHLEDHLKSLAQTLEEDNFASESDKLEISELAETLQNLTISTGCRAQACDIVAQSLSIRKDSSTDYRVWILQDLECTDYFQDYDLRYLMCYHLYTMHVYDDDLEDEVKEKAGVGFNASACDYEFVCEYVAANLWIEDRSDIQVGEMMVDECEMYVDASQTANSRRKREVTEEEEESAEVFDEAKFMKTYMSLSEKTRRLLGHQMAVTPDSMAGDILKGLFIKWLSLELFVDQLNYMKGELSQSAGVRLIIHNPDSYPMPDEFGQDVMPGTASSVSLQLNDISRLPYPHPSDCYDLWDETDMEQSLMNHRRPRYAETDCTRFCLQHEVMKACDCFHTQYDITFMNVSKFAFRSGKPRPCETAEDGPDMDCVNALGRSYSKESTCPTCHPACNETEYANRVTTALWPSNRYWTEFALELGFERDIVFDSVYNAKLKSEIQQNYLRVAIYFQTLNVREVTQTEKYTNDSTFAAVGGALSLFLGVAIILLFEIAELSVDIVINLMGYRAKSSQLK